MILKMHSIHNEGKSAAAEKFIRTSKTKIYKLALLKKLMRKILNVKLVIM